MSWWRPGWQQVYDVLVRLDALLEGQGRVMASLADLSTAIAELSTAVDALVTRAMSPPPVDVSAEVTSVQEATAKVNAALAPSA